MKENELDSFSRPFESGTKPGRFDVDGIEWWACDPYPTWYRWEAGELITPKSTHRWADEPDSRTMREPTQSELDDFDPARDSTMMFFKHEGWRGVYLYAADPNCKHESDERWSGIGCLHCAGWYCL